MAHARSRGVALSVITQKTKTADVITSSSILIRGASAATLYEAYSDLPRMTEWSPLLEEVVFDPSTRESSWGLRVPRALRFLSRAAGFGELAIRWRAVNVEESPPRLLRWKSLSGMENKGSALFEEIQPELCNMTLSIAYPIPPSVRQIAESDLVQRFVRSTMVRTMIRFADVMEREAGQGGV
uniref:Coenzyme Q-binding protein COQ10 START domain-containing protein n=1 Tax=Coccolithus braarudii TaxID=221442 RepID=A0A7S0Q5M8_9EUKA